MKTKYTTLSELMIEAQKYSSEITLENIINERLYFKSWFMASLSYGLKKEAVELVAEKLGGRAKTKEHIKRILANSQLQHWSFRRFSFYFNNSTIMCDYTTGQDQAEEFKAIRNFLNSH